MSAASESKSSLTAVSIGKRKLKLDEFVSLVFNYSAVLDLNAAAADQLTADSAKRGPEPPIQYADEVFDTTNALPSQAVRAILLLRAQSFLQIRSRVRAPVVKFLLDLLNAGICPLLPAAPADKSKTDVNTVILAALAACYDPATKAACVIVGRGADKEQVQSLAAACAAADITIPKLTNYERSRFLMGVLPAQALHILSTGAARALSRVSEAAAGLACEAIMAYTEPFQTNYYDVARPYATAIDTAATVRWLVEGSQTVNKAFVIKDDKGKDVPDKTANPAAFRYIPAVAACLRDAVGTSYNTARIDLNSAEAEGHAKDWQHDPSLSAEHLSQTSITLAHALREAATSSLARTAHIIDAATTGTQAKVIGPLVAPAAAFLADPAAAAAASADASAVDVSAVAEAFVGEIKSIDAALAAQPAPLVAAAPSGPVFALYSLVAAAERAFTLEAAVALQVLGARDAVTQSASRVANAKKALGEAKRLQILAEKAAAAAKAKGGDQAAIDAAIAAATPAAAAAVSRDVKSLVIGIGNTKARNYICGIAAVGSAAPSAALQALCFPALGLGSDAATAPATAAGVVNAITSLRSLIAPQREEAVSVLTDATTPANINTMPKLPKGTRDSGPELMAIREKAFDIIFGVFKRHGAVGIDTPVFERKDTLMGKYGEDSKLIYDLADQGGEILSLRYDLTVPFARFLATSGIQNIRRYHIAKVYRRDNPVLSKGRFREFYQCDYDCAGIYAPMIPDAEVLTVMSEVLEAIDLGSFKIKFNHRKLLDAMMAMAGVTPDKFRPICSAIDKLDKETWQTVEDEMVKQKGLDLAVARRIHTFLQVPASASVAINPEDDAIARAVKKTQAGQMLDALLNHPEFQASADAQKALADCQLLFRYLEAMGALTHISFDLSLARGLDYYTGVIYEAVLTSGTDSVGSIASGGRYDNLVGMFSGKQVPSVGMSIGIERILAILERKEREKGKIRTSTIDVFVASIGANTLTERMTICRELWAAGINAEFLYHDKPHQRNQLEHIIANEIPLAIWIGEDEIRDGKISLKAYTVNKAAAAAAAAAGSKIDDQKVDDAAATGAAAAAGVDEAVAGAHKQEFEGFVSIPRSEMVAKLLERLGRAPGSKST